MKFLFVACLWLASVAMADAEGDALEAARKMNYCTDVSECMPTFVSDDLACPTLCRSTGLLINKRNASAFETLRTKTRRGMGCPVAKEKCEGVPVANQCPLRCLKNKCELAPGAAKGC